MSANGSVQGVVQSYTENGRQYHGFRKGLYMYPCDEEEKDRMDIYHKIFEVARRGKLHEAATLDSSSREAYRIMDLGCGTGIWAIDMADKFPTSEVIAFDLSNIQPEKIPPNLRFRAPHDYEGFWTQGENTWDMIHLQMACGSVSNWPEIYQKIFAHLKPGTGWIEQVEIDLQPRCDDGTLAPDSWLVKWYEYLADATNRANKPIAYNANTRQLLHQQGFTEMQELVIRAPLNGWPTDPHQKTLGRWYNLGLTDGLEALSLGPFSRVNKWNADANIRPLLKEVQKEISNPKVHAYNEIHIWIARRPMS